MNKYFDPLHSICPSDVLISASCTALHEILGFSLADPGQGILVNRPIYGRFELDFGNKMDLKIVYADVGNEEAFGESVVERYEEAVEKAGREGVVVRALMLVNPNNPTGELFAVMSGKRGQKLDRGLMNKRPLLSSRHTRRHYSNV